MGRQTQGLNLEFTPRNVTGTPTDAVSQGRSLDSKQVKPTGLR